MEHISNRHEGDLGGRFFPFADTEPTAVTVVVAPETAHLPAVQHTAWMLINLLARFDGILAQVGLVCPPDVPFVCRTVPLADRRLDLKTAILAGAREIGVVPVIPDLQSERRLMVGEGSERAALYVYGDAWWGGITTTPLEGVRKLGIRLGQEAQHPPNTGTLQHRLTAFGQKLIILAQASVTRQPGKRALHDPTLGQHHKPFLCVRALDNLEVPFIEVGTNVLQLPGIRPIGIQGGQPLTVGFQQSQQLPGSITILDTGSGHHHRPDQAQGVYREVAFAAFDLFAGIIPDSFLRFGRPPFSVVLTDWLSIITTEGSSSLPAWRRT